jgi:hypothetical protein
VPDVRVRGFRFRQAEGKGPDLLRCFLRVAGQAEGFVLERSFLVSRRLVQSVLFAGAHAPTGGRPLIVRRCRLAQETDGSQNDGIVLKGQSGDSRCRSVRIEENELGGLLRGILLLRDAADTQVVCNRVRKCSQAGIQTEDLGPASRGLLLANNTVVESLVCLRLWENGARKGTLLEARLEVCNNLLLDADEGDLGYLLFAGDRVEPRDIAALVARWNWRGNVRDRLGRAGSSIPEIAAVDRLFVANQWERFEKVWWRPKSVSTAREPWLPPWAGAVPPPGAPRWDWDRTWRQRMRAAGKDDAP